MCSAVKQLSVLYLLSIKIHLNRKNRIKIYPGKLYFNAIRQQIKLGIIGVWPFPCVMNNMGPSIPGAIVSYLYKVSYSFKVNLLPQFWKSEAFL